MEFQKINKSENNQKQSKNMSKKWPKDGNMHLAKNMSNSSTNQNLDNNKKMHDMTRIKGSHLEWNVFSLRIIMPSSRLFL